MQASSSVARERGTNRVAQVHGRGETLILLIHESYRACPEVFLHADVDPRRASLPLIANTVYLMGKRRRAGIGNKMSCPREINGEAGQVCAYTIYEL
jgi:hypothetical protein